MKLYLASFLEPHNFGPGRIIGIANGDKPDHLECELVFKELIPNIEIMKEYRTLYLKDRKKASANFINGLTKQLDQFLEDVLNECKKENKTPMELLPFEDGDTLGSWERKAFTNYRVLIAPYLEKLGYEVVVN